MFKNVFENLGYRNVKVCVTLFSVNQCLVELKTFELNSERAKPEVAI